MADTDLGGGMTLKKKMTRTEFRKRADDILMRLTMELGIMPETIRGPQRRRTL